MPSWVGNPALKAPRSTELTAGFEYLRDAFSLRARLFHAHLKDYIYPVCETSPLAYQS